MLKALHRPIYRMNVTWSSAVAFETSCQLHCIWRGNYARFKRLLKSYICLVYALALGKFVLVTAYKYFCLRDYSASCNNSWVR